MDFVGFFALRNETLSICLLRYRISLPIASLLKYTLRIIDIFKLYHYISILISIMFDTFAAYKNNFVANNKQQLNNKKQ